MARAQIGGIRIEKRQDPGCGALACPARRASRVPGTGRWANRSDQPAGGQRPVGIPEINELPQVAKRAAGLWHGQRKHGLWPAKLDGAAKTRQPWASTSTVPVLITQVEIDRLPQGRKSYVDWMLWTLKSCPSIEDFHGIVQSLQIRGGLVGSVEPSRQLASERLRTGLL